MSKYSVSGKMFSFHICTKDYLDQTSGRILKLSVYKSFSNHFSSIIIIPEFHSALQQLQQNLIYISQN